MSASIDEDPLSVKKHLVISFVSVSGFGLTHNQPLKMKEETMTEDVKGEGEREGEGNGRRLLRRAGGNSVRRLMKVKAMPLETSSMTFSFQGNH